MSYLIDIKSIKKQGYVSGNVEDTLIASALMRVQDVILQPIIGTTFYKRLQAGVTDNDLNSDEEFLLNNYIFDFLVSAVDLRITKPLTFRIKAKTVGTMRDEHISPLSNAERTEFEDELRGDMDFYANQLIGYLKDNCDLFPEYKTYLCSFENIPPQKHKDTRTNIRFC